jgi:hypothetical protein
MSSGEPAQAASFEEFDPESPDDTAQDARVQINTVNITYRLNKEKIMVYFLL